MRKIYVALSPLDGDTGLRYLSILKVIIKTIMRYLSILKVIIKTIIYIYYYKLLFHRKRTPAGGQILLVGHGFIELSGNGSGAEKPRSSPVVIAVAADLAPYIIGQNPHIIRT